MPLRTELYGANAMRRDVAISQLKGLQAILRVRGIQHLYLFGSVARDEATEASDIDIAVDLSPDTPFDPFDMGGIMMTLMEALGEKVDLVDRRAFSSRFASQVASDLIRVF